MQEFILVQTNAKDVKFTGQKFGEEVVGNVKFSLYKSEKGNYVFYEDQKGKQLALVFTSPEALKKAVGFPDHAKRLYEAAGITEYITP